MIGSMLLYRTCLSKSRPAWTKMTSFRLLASSAKPDSNEGNFEKQLYNKRLNNESIETKRARLLYQSRKRGILENDLLLSSFAHKYLPSMTSDELDKYDQLINTISNEWEIYYWAVGVKEIPEEYRNSIVQKFVQHVKNENREQRFRQPDLH